MVDHDDLGTPLSAQGTRTVVPRPTITVQYRCRACMAQREPLVVHARQEEDVIDWMNATVLRVAQDHRAAFPHCRATHLDELLIPHSGDGVGTRAEVM